jgi:hypothetical protein
VLATRGAKHSQPRESTFQVKFDRQAQEGVEGAGVTVLPVAEGRVLQFRQFPLVSGREMVALHVHEASEAIFNGSEQTQVPDYRAVLQLQTK